MDVSLEVDAQYDPEWVCGVPFCHLMSTCNKTPTLQSCVYLSMTESVGTFPEMGFSQGKSRREGSGEKSVYGFA